MDAIKSFFQKYGAVPANDYGPVWSQATDAALFHHVSEDCQLWRDDPASRPHLQPRMVDVYRELQRRWDAAKDLDEQAKYGTVKAKIAGCIGGVRLAMLIEEAKL